MRAREVETQRTGTGSSPRPSPARLAPGHRVERASLGGRGYRWPSQPQHTRWPSAPLGRPSSRTLPAAPPAGSPAAAPPRPAGCCPLPARTAAWHAGTISVPVCAAHGIWQLQALGGRRTAGAAAGWCAAATRAAPSGTNLPRWAAIAAMSLRFCIGLSISEDWMSYSEERTASRRQQQPA